MLKKGELTSKQQRFVDEYIVDLNATNAATRSGYSQANADKIGSQLVGKTRVKAAIAQKLKERSLRATVTADNILSELILIAMANPMKCFYWDGKALALNPEFLKDPILSKTIESVSIGKSGISLKFINRTRALETILKYLGTTPENGESEETPLEQITRIIRERVESERLVGETLASPS